MGWIDHLCFFADLGAEVTSHCPALTPSLVPLAIRGFNSRFSSSRDTRYGRFVCFTRITVVDDHGKNLGRIPIFRPISIATDPVIPLEL